jgi:HEAT repeat protein
MSTSELVRQLQDPSAEVRLAAARALDDVPQTVEVEQALLAAARHDHDPMVRKWSLHALGCTTCKPDGVCSTEVVSSFVDALRHDRNAKVRRFAAGMMMHGQLGTDDRIVEAFRAVADHPQRILRERAAWFLGRYVPTP